MFSNPINKIERFIYLVIIITLLGLAFNFKVGKDFYEGNTQSLSNSLIDIQKNTSDLEKINYQQDTLITQQIAEIREKERKINEAINAGSITKEEAEKQIVSLKTEIDEIKKNLIVKNEENYYAALNDVMIQTVRDTIVKKEFAQVVKYVNDPSKAIDSLEQIFNQRRLKLVDEINRLNQAKNNLEDKIAKQQSRIEYLNTEMGGMASKKIEIKDVEFSFLKTNGNTEKGYNFERGAYLKLVNVFYKLSKFSTVDKGSHEITMKYYDPSGSEIYASRTKQTVYFNGIDSSPYSTQLVNQNGFKKGTHTVKFFYNNDLIQENSFIVDSTY